MVDADVIASFWIRGPRATYARKARRRDAGWVARLLPDVAVPLEEFVA